MFKKKTRFDLGTRLPEDEERQQKITDNPFRMYNYVMSWMPEELCNFLEMFWASYGKRVPQIYGAKRFEQPASYYRFTVWVFRNFIARGERTKSAGVREAILERDGHQCVICGKTKNLEVHHLVWRVHSPSMLNLLTLCAHCHRAIFHGQKYPWVFEAEEGYAY